MFSDQGPHCFAVKPTLAIETAFVQLPIEKRRQGASEPLGGWDTKRHLRTPTPETG